MYKFPTAKEKRVISDALRHHEESRSSYDKRIREQFIERQCFKPAGTLDTSKFLLREAPLAGKTFFLHRTHSMVQVKELTSRGLIVGGTCFFYRDAQTNIIRYLSSLRSFVAMWPEYIKSPEDCTFLQPCELFGDIAYETADRKRWDRPFGLYTPCPNSILLGYTWPQGGDWEIHGRAPYDPVDPYYYDDSFAGEMSYETL